MTPLLPWMRLLLRFAGTFNLLAGTSMICLYHEGYKLLGVPKPELVLPVQVMGILVALFGVGYHLRGVQSRGEPQPPHAGVLEQGAQLGRWRYGTWRPAGCPGVSPWWSSSPT